jgi:hypothetical protein
MAERRRLRHAGATRQGATDHSVDGVSVFKHGGRAGMKVAARGRTREWEAGAGAEWGGW